MSRRAWMYVGGVLALGTLLSGLALSRLTLVQAPWPTFAVLTVLATLAQLYKAEAPNHQTYFATPVFIFAGLLLLQPSLVVPLVAIPHLVEWAKERWQRSPLLRAWYLQPFNIAMAITASSGAHAVYVALDTARTPVGAVPAVISGAAAAVTYVAINQGLLGQALVLARGVSWRRSGVLDGESLQAQAILLFVGYVVAVLWRLNPWLILPALSPLALIYRALTIPQLKHAAQVDSKTGLFNARHFDILFTAEFERARRFNRPVAVIMADLDHFKTVNDRYGHLAGDTVLAGVGQILRATSRAYEVVGRFGGEEFAVVVPEAGLLEAQMLAERIRQAVATHAFTVAASPTPLHITMSLGVACFSSDASTPTDLTHAADVAVYQAKAAGRNRVVCAADVPRSLVQTHATPAAGPVAPAALAALLAGERTDDSAPAVVAAPAVVVATDPTVLTDQLTGLGTHHAFYEEMRRALARATLLGETAALARIDLDEFKVINDQHGHVYGDAVLGGLATVLRGGRAQDRAFRLGGDEFALLLPRTNLPEAVSALERLRAETTRCLSGVTVSVGVATLVPDEHDLETWQDQAGAALGAAKRRGRNGVVTFAQVQDDVSLLPAAKVAAVRHLLAGEHIDVAFQPIWDLEHGTILAVEALARPAAAFGLSGPQEAFDIAERTGHAHALDALCRQAILRRAALLSPDTLLFLNVSPHTLEHGGLNGSVLVDAVAAAGLSPERVVLEITERSVARPGVVVREVKRLRQLGFRVALDDTGAGNAGLEMLSQVPVDFVKIDRTVVARALTDTAARAVLAGIIAIAQETGAYVIAEGIEDSAMLALVRGVGVAEPTNGTRGGVQGVQGFLLGRPSQTMPVALAADHYRTLLHAA